MFTSCNLFFDTISVEVPKGFVGWCYVIPVRNKSVSVSAVAHGSYQVGQAGIVKIPSSVFQVHRDHVIRIYEAGVDITADKRYSGSVHRTNDTDTIKYDYIQFYLPSYEERKIPDVSVYWRNKMYEYRSKGARAFDSLFRAGEIVF
jgi:hypothetical protein